MKVEGLILNFILRATGGTFSGRRKEITGISVDSRTIKKGEVFFALKGENYDGHSFCEEVFIKGCSYVVIEKDLGIKNDFIRVKNTLEALGNLAKRWRQKFNLKCVAITGTSGKTTTRRIINYILKDRYECTETMKNYNNMVGLPLSVLQIRKKTEIAILEMAMNSIGEIKRLSHIADPHVGIITNVGRGHLEFLGSIQNVAKAKSELLLYLKEGDVAILNRDDPFLMNIRNKTKAEVITYGIENRSDFKADTIKIGKRGSSFAVNGEGPFHLPLLGKINIYNALAAIATSSLFGLGSEKIKERLKSVKPEPLRLNRISHSGIIIFNDSYNANPDSMAAALSIVAAEKGKRKIACLGDMLELGKKSVTFHKEVGRKLDQYGFNIIFLYGPLSMYILRSVKKKSFKGKVLHFKDKEKLTRKLIDTIKKGDVVLIKGSHNNRLDIVADALIKNIKGRR